jgi:hypothetical protein
MNLGHVSNISNHIDNQDTKMFNFNGHIAAVEYRY